MLIKAPEGYHWDSVVGGWGGGGIQSKFHVKLTYSRGWSCVVLLLSWVELRFRQLLYIWYIISIYLYHNNYNILKYLDGLYYSSMFLNPQFNSSTLQPNITNVGLDIKMLLHTPPWAPSPPITELNVRVEKNPKHCKHFWGTNWGRLRTNLRWFYMFNVANWNFFFMRQQKCLKQP